MPEQNPFMTRWGTATEDGWLNVMLTSFSQPTIDGVDFPTMPDKEKQKAVHGNSDEISIRGSHQFYSVVRRFMAENDVYFTPGRKFLDFGSGWGRTIRPFMRDLELSDLIGVEPHQPSCITARKCNPHVAIIQSDFRPPLPFRSDYFSYIVSYSIFTHLPEFLFDAWMDEFERVMLPGGILAFTFLGEQTMSQLNKYPKPLPEGYVIHDWHKTLLTALAKDDPGNFLYKNDNFVFLQTGRSDLYGDTFASPDLIKRKLEDKFDVLKISSDILAQDLCLVRKRR